MLNPRDYGFSEVAGPAQIVDSLGYLIGLVDSPAHKISDPLPAQRILSWLYGIEEQMLNAEHLLQRQEFFNRYFAGGYHPQTPCMVVKKWSPICAMLERGFSPEILNRNVAKSRRVLATGIWKPCDITSPAGIESAATDEELFWAVMAEVSARAKQRAMWISVIAEPGWSSDSAIGSLPKWPQPEIAKADRVLWKRTPKG